MRCPFCKSKDTAVVDSRASEDGFSIRRRRQCSHCGKRFTTFIEQRLRSLGEREVKSEKVGEFVLEELKRLDKIAYVRFASVYFNVEDPEAFKRLMRDLEIDKNEAK